MKIFSWVHRKLNQKEGLFGGNLKKDEVIIISKNENIGDKQHLLQDDSMLGGCWKGGILTIGTFGFDPLIKDQIISDMNEDIEDHDECEIIEVSDHEEVNPSMLYANNGHEVLISQQEAPMANVMPVARRTDDDDDESNKGSKKERITLADLFSADQFSDDENAKLPDLCDDVTNVNKKTSKLPQVKNGVSFAKKIIPRVKEDSRRILKLHKLMTKALKKKVHPDMESKNNKNNRVIAAASTMLKQTVTSESISLLEILETTA